MVDSLNSRGAAVTALPSARGSRLRRPLAVLAIVGLIVLTGCANANSTSTVAATDATTPALKLALGTLHLEGTDQAVDAATAEQLLPLWQLMDELNSSSATAPAEMTAVLERIESIMTPAQLKAIEALNLSQSDVTGRSGRSAADASTTSGSGSQSASPAGRMFVVEAGGAGGMPLDGGGPMPGGGAGQGSSASTTNSTSSSTSVIKEVIQLLERKLQN